jgi:hypothetical protein
MKKLFTFARSASLALATCLPSLTWGQQVAYDDGSEADVYYFADESASHQVAATSDTSAAHTGDAPLTPTPDEYASPNDGVYGKTANGGWAEPTLVEPEYGAHCDDCFDPGCIDWGNPKPCTRRNYFQGDYLMWWLKGDSAPPLATTSPLGTPIVDAGVLPDADILFPNERIGADGRPGGRFTLGHWFDDCQDLAVEGTYFFLAKGGDGVNLYSDSEGEPIIARPFFNTISDEQDSVIVAYPGEFAGSLNIATSSDLLGAEANLRSNWWRNRCNTVDLLAGYRFIRLYESINVYENQVAIDPFGTVPLGTSLSIQDNFVSQNQFHGGQIGLNWKHKHNRWTIDTLAKLAFGNVHQRMRIGGFTQIDVPNQAPERYDGGILALESNSGNYERDRFAVIPEFGVNLTYCMRESWSVRVGYTFMYLSHMVRPGGNIDTNLDPDQFPPPLASGDDPEFRFKQTGMWLQGVSAGLEYRF